MRIRAFVLALAVVVSTASAQAAFRVAVWIPGWSQDGLRSMQLHAGSVGESNPVWYVANADGSVAKKYNAEDPSLRAAMTGTSIIPTIQNNNSNGFDATLGAALIATPESRESHAAAIAAVVRNNAFDGIDIDYERVPTASRANFTAFVQTLAKKLHDSGKKLSVTVYAKTSDAQNWNGPGSQDWAAIGAAADSVKIMAYDYHWDGSAAGAITPLTWLDQVTTYAKSVIPAAKVMIALPWYGYDWLGTDATDVSFAGATTIATNNAINIGHDENGEATFTYNGRTVFFIDSSAYEKKLNLLKTKHASIGGVAHWAVGQEDPAVWNVLKGSTNPVTTAPADYTVAGPSQLALQAGMSTSGEYRLTPINGFSGTATVRVQAATPFAGTITPSATTVTNAAPVTLRVEAPRNTPAGSYQVRVQFVTASAIREQVVTISVSPAAPGKIRAIRR
ncbi:MAG TPA: glycosyl hydrolase family 18 protein [Thermoanaerobaculia bacterium]|nr:glycosyl hydrolase family 18 protein [Thermoanaerobaculia bacterium]